MPNASRSLQTATPWLCKVAAALAACAVLLACSSQAHAQIKNPGDHSKYGVELDGHLVWQWANQYWWDDDGIGLGMRASIPVMQDGPITTINNNLAISFGLDWAHFDYGCGPGLSCTGNDFWIPVVVQWNFFLTNVVSLFPELGLAMQHSQLSTDYNTALGCRVTGNRLYCGDTSHTRMELVLWLGSRFMLSKSVALTVRLGTPSLLLGVSVLL